MNQLIPLFLTAEENTLRHQNQQQQQPHQLNPLTTNDDIFLHLQYHPENPPSRSIQRLWQGHIWTPPNKSPFSQLKNRQELPIPICKLTVAYSRAPNLGNILSYCKFCRNINQFIGVIQTESPQQHENIWTPTMSICKDAAYTLITPLPL